MRHLLAFILVAIQLSLTAQSTDWKTQYEKAVVATFYSASSLNGHHELEVAHLYLDSASAAIAIDTAATHEDRRALEALRFELSITEDIAADNLNFIYPAFAAIKGDRADFNVVDDAEELLIESLVERGLGIADPLYRGLLKENGHHVVAMVQPYNPVHVTVVLDFLTNETPAYAIRPHELMGVLGESGWDRYQSGQLDSLDWVAIQGHFGVEQLVVFEVTDAGSIIPSPENPTLFYKGLRVHTVDDTGHMLMHQHFEDFRIDKASSWMQSAWLVCLNVLLALAFLTLISGVVFRKERLRWDGGAVLQLESLKRNLLVMAVAGVAVVLMQWLGGAFMPDANAFQGEGGSKIWLVYFVVAPTLGASVLAYLAMKRFADGLVDDMTNLARVLYAAFMAHFIYLGFFTHYSMMMPVDMMSFVAVVPALFVMSPSFFLGFSLERILKKARRPWHEKGALFVVLGLSYVAFWLDFQHAFTESYVLHGGVFLVAACYLMVLPALMRKPQQAEVQLANHDWASPYQTIWKGTNSSQVLESLQRFVGTGGAALDNSPVGFDIEPMLFVLSGEPGMGKSRLMKGVLQQGGFSEASPFAIDLYYGDFNEQTEGQTEAYEPFSEAFSDALELPAGFFSDRSAVGRKLGSLIKQGVDVAGMGDIGAAFEVEDDGGQRSLEEMSEELVGKLVERASGNKGETGRLQLVIIDHYDWAKDDPQSHDLMKAFLRRLLLQRKLQKLLRVVVVYDGLGEGQEPREVRELLDMAPGRSETHALIWDGSAEDDEGRGRKKFMEVLLERGGFMPRNPSERIRFDRNIRLHLESVCLEDGPAFNPGDVFAYLHALEEAGAMRRAGADWMELIREQLPEDLNLAQGKLDELKRLFRALNSTDQKLLGMAANVGFKFDATILASICGRDLLEVLEQLSELEGQFVLDQAEEDNVYSFANRELHRAIVRETSRGRQDHEFMQILVEYHKRTVGSMQVLGDGYVQRLDLEILGSTADSALRPAFLSVDAIRETAPFVTLHAALAGLRVGRVRKAESWVVGLVSAGLPWWTSEEGERTSDPKLMSAVLTGANDGPGLRGFDVPLDSGIRVLDAVLDGLEHVQDAAVKEAVLVALYRDLYTHGPARNEQDKVRLAPENWSRRKARVEDLWSGLPTKGQAYRFSFYQQLMEADQDVVKGLESLLQEIRQAHPDHSLPLEGEVLRHLARTVKADDLKRKHAYAVEALQFEARRIGVALPSVEEDNPTWDEVMAMVQAMLAANRPTADFNFTLSRLRDVAYEEEEYDLVLQLADLAEEMSKALSDKVGMMLAKSFRGAALFRKQEHEASLEVYRDYTDFLKEEGRPKTDFRIPLEGILRNVEALDCPEVFLEEMKGLYSHLKFISQEMKEEEFSSPISDGRLLGDLIPGARNASPLVQTEAGEEEREKAMAILEVLSCIAMADGEFEEHEHHDLRESATALAVCLHLPDQLMREESKRVASRIQKIQDHNERKAVFRKALEKVASGEGGRRFQRAVVQLCWDMAYADGVLEDKEREYLELAKSMLKS